MITKALKSAIRLIIAITFCIPPHSLVAAPTYEYEGAAPIPVEDIIGVKMTCSCSSQKGETIFQDKGSIKKIFEPSYALFQDHEIKEVKPSPYALYYRYVTDYGQTKKWERIPYYIPHVVKVGKKYWKLPDFALKLRSGLYNCTKICD